MDRRSWLWRRKSSEKSPGETESTGSASSPRFSDEQANISHRTQSPEITSKVASSDVITDKIKALTEELNAARLSISAKEELAKQHAKVAEDAVTGWEKAERGLSSLKLQHEAAVKKNSALEDRVGHLDGALKECVRQLRQAREEQDRKLELIITERTKEWECRKSELETQLSELSARLETARSEAKASVEKENKTLRLELNALSHKLQVTTLERDLSTKGAESASKQHLEGVKKIVKLEAECRGLRYLTRRPPEFVESQNGARDSATDAEVDHLKGENGFGRKLVPSSSGVLLMDDFLEMERLAAMPEVENKGHGEEYPSKADLEAMRKRGVDLEDKIKKLEAEKLKLEMALDESQSHLQASQRKLKDAEEDLKTSQAKLNAAETELIERENQKNAAEERLKDSDSKSRESAIQLIEREDQLNASQGQLKTAEANLEEIRLQLIEREEQLKASEGCLKEAEDELVKMKTEFLEREGQIKASQRRLEEADNETRMLKSQLFESEDQIRVSQQHLEEAEVELGMLKSQLFESEDKFKKSQGQVKDTEARLVETQTQLSEWQGKFVDLQTQLALTSKLKQLVEEELKASDAKREKAELQVKALESETRSLLARINSLADEADRERTLSAEVSAKSQRLENELSQKRPEPYFPQGFFRKAKKVEQEKELTTAASKLVDCQKTIASLGEKLKSLAMLDEFLLDSENPLELSGESLIFPGTGQLVKMPSIDCQRSLAYVNSRHFPPTMTSI